MSGFAVCVLVEWFLAVHSTWCSSGWGPPCTTLENMGLGMQLHAGSCSCPALSPQAFWV